MRGGNRVEAVLATGTPMVAYLRHARRYGVGFVTSTLLLLLREGRKKNGPKRLLYQSETELWAAFQRGDERAFRQVYGAHFRPLMNYGLRLCNSVAVVEDGIQDLFLELWQYRLRLTQPQSVRFYLLRGLRNRLAAHLRQSLNSREIPLDEDAYPFALEASSEQRWIDLDVDEALRHRIRHALDQLTPRQREILYLRYFNDLSYEQICELLGINYQSARSQVYQALKVLRQRLGPEFFGMLAACVWI